MQYLRTLHLGPDDLLIEAKATLTDSVEGDAVARAIDEVEHRIREQVPEARIIAIEPDVPQADDPDRPPW